MGIMYVSSCWCLVCEHIIYCRCLPTPMTLASRGWSPIFTLVVHVASFSVNVAISAVTPAGSVHKSRGDNVVRMWMQLKRCVCVLGGCYKEGIVLMDVIWRRLRVSMI